MLSSCIGDNVDSREDNDYCEGIYTILSINCWSVNLPIQNDLEDYVQERY